jgi:hypothetical protein
MGHWVWVGLGSGFPSYCSACLSPYGAFSQDQSPVFVSIVLVAYRETNVANAQLDGGGT